MDKLLGWLFDASCSYTVLLLGITLCLTIWFYVQQSRQLPPGPWGLPIVGYYPFIASPPHIYLGQLAKKYGDIMSFNSTGTLFIHLNKMDVIKEVLVTRNDEFNGRPLVLNFLSWVDGGYGIAQEEGAVWKEQRRFFLQAVKEFGFGKLDMEGRIHDELQVLLKDLNQPKGKLTDLLIPISHMTSSVISRILWSKPFQKDDPIFQEIAFGLHHIFKFFFASRVFAMGPFLYCMMKFLKDGREAEKAKKVLHEAIRKIVDDHMESFNKEDIRDYVDVYIEERRKLKEKGELHNSTFTVERLYAVALGIYLEATESITFAVCSLLKELSKHQNVQKEIQKELDNVVGRERLASWMDRQNLLYTEAAILELFRCAGIFNITGIFSNYEETTLRGYRIPKRSVLVSNYHSLNIDPELFPNPNEFDPLRYIGPDGKRIRKEGLFPYGMGKRSCAGESLAQMEVLLIISTIMQNFSLTPNEKDSDSFHVYIEVTIQIGWHVQSSHWPVVNLDELWKKINAGLV